MRTTITTLAVAVFLLAGCCTLPQSYVEQDRRNYDTLTPRIETLLDSSDHYTDTQEQDIRDRLTAWNARIVRGEKLFK